MSQNGNASSLRLGVFVKYLINVVRKGICTLGMVLLSKKFPLRNTDYFEHKHTYVILHTHKNIGLAENQTRKIRCVKF